jgi:hypothetical protein
MGEGQMIVNDSEFGCAGDSGADDLIFGGKKIIEIVITHHARTRWNDRIESAASGATDIAGFVWDKLKAGAIRSYYRNEEDVYLIDEDLVMVAEFTPLKRTEHVVETTYYRMIVVTFLGRMSETMELRDLKSYYSWLRHSRRMTLIKNSRKRR